MALFAAISVGLRDCVPVVDLQRLICSYARKTEWEYMRDTLSLGRKIRFKAGSTHKFIDSEAWLGYSFKLKVGTLEWSDGSHMVSFWMTGKAHNHNRNVATGSAVAICKARCIAEFFDNPDLLTSEFTRLADLVMPLEGLPLEGGDEAMLLRETRLAAETVIREYAANSKKWESG